MREKERLIIKKRKERIGEKEEEGRKVDREEKEGDH